MGYQNQLLYLPLVLDSGCRSWGNIQELRIQQAKSLMTKIPNTIWVRQDQGGTATSSPSLSRFPKCFVNLQGWCPFVQVSAVTPSNPGTW